MEYVDNWVNNNGVIIHYLKSKSESKIIRKSPIARIIINPVEVTSFKTGCDDFTK